MKPAIPFALALVAAPLAVVAQQPSTDVNATNNSAAPTPTPTPTPTPAEPPAADPTNTQAVTPGEGVEQDAAATPPDPITNRGTDRPE